MLGGALHSDNEQDLISGILVSPWSLISPFCYMENIGKIECLWFLRCFY